MKHELYKCPPGCDDPHCQYCMGGLAFCTVCGGAEVTLPAECPGKWMEKGLEKLVADQAIDFKDGKWMKR